MNVMTSMLTALLGGLILATPSWSQQEPIEDVLTETSYRLEDYQDLRVDELLDSIEERPLEIKVVGQDPTKADFFELVERELKLGAEDVGLLDKNGFVLVDPQVEQ